MLEEWIRYFLDMVPCNLGDILDWKLLVLVLSIYNQGLGAGKKDQADKNNGIIQIRPTNIDRNGMLIFDKNIYVPFDAAMPSLQKDDVLFNNTNSQELVGKTAIYKGRYSV